MSTQRCCLQDQQLLASKLELLRQAQFRHPTHSRSSSTDKVEFLTALPVILQRFLDLHLHYTCRIATVSKQRGKNGAAVLEAAIVVHF
jgi:hypothetical protein